MSTRACCHPTRSLCHCAAVSRVQARFNAFIRTFKELGTDEDYKYMQLLQEVRARDVCPCFVHCRAV